MIRLLLLTGLLFGFGFGVQRGWLEIRWDRLGKDLQQKANPVTNPGGKTPPP